MGTNIQSIIFYFFQRIFVYYHCTENKSVIPKLEEIISSNTRITLFSILSRTQFAEKKPAHFVLAFHFGKHVSSNLYFIIVLNFFHCYWQLWKTSLVLCWVLFISTQNENGLIDHWILLLPTMLGSFHFYKKWIM